mgnify:CR=1 FL=1
MPVWAKASLSQSGGRAGRESFPWAGRRWGVAGVDEGRADRSGGGAAICLWRRRLGRCGVNPMYSMRYGTGPVVHGGGGLGETVVDDSPGAPQPNGGGPLSTRATGFVFREYTPPALLGALNRALTLFRDRPRWQALQAAGMRPDFSWDRSAQ